MLLKVLASFGFVALLVLCTLPGAYCFSVPEFARTAFDFHRLGFTLLSLVFLWKGRWPFAAAGEALVVLITVIELTWNGLAS